MIDTNNSEVNIEELRQLIRTEVIERKKTCEVSGNNMAVRKPQYAAEQKNPFSGKSSGIKLNTPDLQPLSLQPEFHPKTDGRYYLSDLLFFQDEAFINAAYRCILMRGPDAGGYQHFLSMLRNGCNKVDILGRLRYSKEGRSAGTKIHGLMVPFFLQQVYRIPLIGRITQILSIIWHLPDFDRNHRAFENHTLLLMEHAQKHLNGSLKTLLTHIRKSLAEQLSGMASQVEVEQFKAGIQEQLSGMAGQVEIEQLKASQSNIDQALLAVKIQANQMKSNLLDQDRRLGLLMEEARKRLPDPISTEQIETMLTEDDHRLNAMYASFEDHFRGTREDIKERVSIYLPMIREANAGSADAPVLDLGCGRGEWLELLRDNGLVATGVDTNRIFLNACREIDLKVIENDAISYLCSLKTNSVGTVTAFHLIEHLPTKALIALMDETLRVLSPGGMVILETPNPANMQVGSCNFYFDPTHRNPLPGPLTQYLLEARGFCRTQFLPLHPYGETSDRLTEGDPQVQRVVNQFLFGPQDYAVVAYKA